MSPFGVQAGYLLLESPTHCQAGGVAVDEQWEKKRVAGVADRVSEPC